MKRKAKKVFKITFIILLIMILSCLSAYMYLRNRIYSSDAISFSEKEAGIPRYFDSSFQRINPLAGTIALDEENQGFSDQDYKEQEGVINVLLIGTDGRTLNENCRSDSIIIATLDTNHKKIKYTSIMRDSYVQIKGHGEDKINSAFAYGGPKLLIDTIYRNFNIKLDKYILVNFWGFEDIVNELGGIDIEIKDYEIKEMNKYIGEVDKLKSPNIVRPGLQHLDGQQALAYSRIRKVGNGSYERTERQRRVLTEVGKKVMNINPVQYPSILNTIIQYFKTNVEPIQLMNYAYTAYTMGDVAFEGLQLPASELCEGTLYRGTWVFLIDKQQNARILNEFIFNDKKYNPQNVDRRQVQSVIEQYKNKE
ncbi:LCP family protein [Clostridium manihotivorum]|uniref:LytR family transcriptional regulator n=1 Tax=Clostridium manihotivorum TaxID=2320868 RepID=A0A410DXF7_9CLOT|nr:LCP family protein [Clostridium manihotivorum]QAA33876.1 LytR family transcriptional regulator [Clostridium manihotivorum]